LKKSNVFLFRQKQVTLEEEKKGPSGLNNGTSSKTVVKSGKWDPLNF